MQTHRAAARARRRASSRSRDGGAETGDSVVLNMTRRKLAAEGQERGAAGSARERRRSSSGPKAIRPGFDAELVGLEPGAQKTFTITFPADYRGRVAGRGGGRVRRVGRRRAAQGPAGARRRVLEGPGLLGSLDELRTTVRERLQREATRHREREIRQDLLRAAGAARDRDGARGPGRRAKSIAASRSWRTSSSEQGVDPRQLEHRLGRAAEGPARAGGGDGRVRAGAGRDCAARGV